MENFIVSARKYRPQTFEQVVGQQHVTRTLLNAIAQNHLAQALLFTGPRGVGKTTCARILARMINEEEGAVSDQDFSFNIFELDAASNNSVDDIRSLIDQVRFAPQVGSFKVYIIDEVHMLSAQAFNAFLKTLEEPPKHAIFILATTEKHKIIPTILSRCQIYDFKRIGMDDITAHLKSVAEQEGIAVEIEALNVIAQKADGALRDALSIFDRIVSFSGNSITYQDVIDNLRILDYDYYFRTADLMMKQDRPALLLLFDEILDNGFDGHQYINGLAAHFRDLLVCKDERTLELLEVSASTRLRYQEQSKAAPVSFLLKALKLSASVDNRYKTSNNPRLLVELCLLETASLLQGEPQKKTPDQALASATSAPAPPVKKDSPKHHSPAPKEDTSTEATAAASPSAESSMEVAEEAPSIIPQESSSEITSKPVDNAPKPRSRRRSGSGISIKEALVDQKPAEEEEEQKERLQDLPKDNFDATQLKSHWHEFLQQMKREGRQKNYSSLSNKEPVLKENFKIELTLDNDIQVAFFNEEQAGLLNFLRSKLNNFSLQFEVIKAANSQTLEPYSPQEKYEYMLKKNPLLQDFRKTLDLDLE